MVQLLHSCGPLFKIIRVCGPQPAKNTYFCPKIRVFSKKKKKDLHLKSVCKIPIFVPKSGCSLKKKKKGLHLKSVCKIPIFDPKSGCSLKKKRSSLEIGPQNSYFRPKIRVFSKKKKVFNWNRSTKFLFSSQNHSVLQKKKLPLLVLDKTCAKLFREPVVGPR